MSDDEFDAYDFSEFTEEDFAAIDAELARARAGPAIQIAIEKNSPFRQFLSWKYHFAVTDLVSPVWCEVQYEYGLYGQRHKPFHTRPRVFSAKSGKRIRVREHVAHQHDRRLKRGKSVHQALEDEVKPEKIIVRPANEEERFGLRLVELIDGFNQLVCNGMTRELPVFTITHSQVVGGIIDEVVRSPLAQSNHPPRSPSASPRKKKQRVMPTQTPNPTSPAQVLSPANTVDGAEKYELRIIDYKTRHSPGIPADEDSQGPRLQLMMYHRMLSSVLSFNPSDFDQLWNKLNLNPTKPFSPQFLKDILWEQRQVNPADDGVAVDLNRLVSEWISAVQRNSVDFAGISQQLEIVYRSPVYVGKQQENGKQNAVDMVDTDNSLKALALQEELDLARAVEESLGEPSPVTRHVAQNIEQAGRSCVAQNNLDSLSDYMPISAVLAESIHQSATTCTQDALVKMQELDTTHEASPVTSEEQRQEATTTSGISPIIGKRVFSMDDMKLDAYIADVLQWWFGARPPRGVNIDQTHRCDTCEYLDSCEWRERKAHEATTARLGKIDE